MRILLVEDEHKIANSIKQGLEQEKYAVDVSYTGIDGYDLASTEDYDLIILDLMLPGMSGLEICQKLRQKNIHLPILILTAKGDISDKVTGLDNGADDYLTKPFAFEELLARIRALIRRPHQVDGAILKLGGLVLNPANYEVIYNRQLIRLTSKEFSLLEYFMRHPNQILTKDQIISHVWNYESDILPNTVEVYVGYLRKKLKSTLLTTVRGFGYKLCLK